MSALDRLRPLLGRPHRHVVVLGAAALLVVVSIVSVVATRGSDASVEPTTTTTVATTTTTTAPTTTTTTRPRSVAPLTGMEGNFQGRIRRPALIVKIDNVPEARPQSGLNQADIVFEEAVEGNVSRLAAVFHSTDSSGVGPVRSVRTTDLELLGLFGRVLFASSGGNGGVVPQLHNTDAVDIGDNVSHQGFFRAGGRPAPHNLFSSTLELYRKAPESPPPPRRVFSYLRRGERLPAGAIPVGGIALRFGGPEISRFTWDAASGTWPRTQSGTPHVDAAGVQVAPENVVVAEVDYDRSGQLGRSVPHGIVTGRGRVVVLTRGKAIRGTWVRPTLAHPLRLVADSGAEIKLTPGQTFVELPVRGGWSFV
jgi:hypothetical protein